MWGKKTSKASSYHDMLERINECIRQGKGAEAKSILHAIDKKKLSDVHERTRYANLARRLSLPNEALKVLHPFVRPKGKEKVNATEEELLEYAASLIKIDTITEAQAILKKLDAKSQPKVYLHTAFSYVENWDYEESVKWLEKYINVPSLSDYEKLVAKANLCEGMVYLKYPNALKVIEETLSDSIKHGFNIITGHVQMTRCAFAVENKEWHMATQSLQVAEKYFSNSETLEAFFIRKWRAILTFYQSEKHDLKALHVIRKEADEKWRHWGTVRDCDFYEAVVTKNEEIFKRLYYGTPHQSFRTRLLRFWNIKDLDQKAYYWKLNGTSGKGKIFELFSGKSTERASLLKSGKQTLALLSILSSDLYRPKRTAYIFSQLYEGEHFNPETSPGRVRNTLFRIRTWLKSNGFPFEISEEKGIYNLSSSLPVTLVIPNVFGESNKEKSAHKADLLQSLLINRSNFTVKDTIEVLNISRRSANRLLSEALKSGLLARTGSGKNTGYTWVEEKQVFLKAG